ncbi:MAG: 30S ribosomal protein S1 [Oligoflexales bacterium]|nr:30S ribosomal protein S1 [Oligoflexales bacterium]
MGSIRWEDEDTGFDEVSKDGEFASLLNEESENTIKEGSIVKGRVTRVSDDYVYVDIGHKMEGEIPKDEFRNLDGVISIKAGDAVEVYLDRFEDGHGDMVLSHERAEMLRAWDRFALAFENSEIVEGIITSRVKGGLSVDIGVKAFLPGSQIDLRPVRNLDKLIGEKLQFKIIKFNKKRGNIVLSRRVLLERDRDQMRKETLENLGEGAILRGVVKNITDYGAFVDLGGIDGLLHITDMSWGRINHPSQMFDVGQELQVKVMSYDPEKKRVSLGYKQLQTDPWQEAAKKFASNTITKGKVVSLADYGAFVELQDGVEGLIHISEMSWSKRVKHPSQIVNVGDEVEVMVLSIDEENRRISLGMKQIEPNPWEIVKEKYHVNDVIRGKIRNITDFGLFVGIEEGIDGLIHISDISWTERVKHPGDLFKKGDEVEAKILQIDTEGEKFSLGIKQLSEDPWIKTAAAHPAGSKGKGRITKIADFGVFVELAPGIEGMVHVSELDSNEIKHPNDVVKEGEELDFIVLSSDSEERKFSLSRKAFQKNLAGEELRTYIDSVAEPKTSFAEAFSRAKSGDEET